MSDTTPIKVIEQGGPKLSIFAGLDLKRGEDVAAFYVDMETKRCEIDAYNDGDFGPEIAIGHNDMRDSTLISFPEFKGWNVHCASVAKYTIAVCLTLSKES